ncbi:hypothetical protein I6I76_10100 [Dermacoccus nishinomiyaensis]|uniref:hypothetical protein n=1 Tax=Dermacoccus nishinomiyaensis TaxID=1274 RepID=UPI000E1BC1B8|nr:hypothetical protein [Dermacoccus nishinomiyaensis]QQY23884.1 hypothetical protein I6I76_10100 [Dermacoccus nishinomiyaensis]
MVHLLEPSDLEPFADIEQAKALAMIEDAEATAATVAPCILEDDFLEDATRKAYVKAVIRGAVLRWNESGTGAYQAQTAGPFGVTMDTRQQRRGMLFPSEIEQLQEACKRYRAGDGSGDGAAATISMIPNMTPGSPLDGVVVNGDASGLTPMRSGLEWWQR